MECTASKLCLPLLFTVMYISWNIESNVFISDYYLLLLPITASWWGLKSVTLVSLSRWSSVSLVPHEHQRHSVLLETLCFASLSWELHQIAIVYNGFLQIEDIVCESECEREREFIVSVFDIETKSGGWITKLFVIYSACFLTTLTYRYKFVVMNQDIVYS